MNYNKPKNKKRTKHQHPIGNKTTRQTNTKGLRHFQYHLASHQEVPTTKKSCPLILMYKTQVLKKEEIARRITSKSQNQLRTLIVQGGQYSLLRRYHWQLKQSKRNHQKVLPWSLKSRSLSTRCSRIWPANTATQRWKAELSFTTGPKPCSTQSLPHP